ncbi:MAG: dethiobiotin synthase [Pseudomonadales bacterium]|nr:dethiobiotin synthase [Gammaproteobacteria bacterium]NNL56616.1 dethiobiotin synthase [Pseudomonadales bacterium]
MPKHSCKILFVTGTDTEVGKTLVSCALLGALQDRGFSTAALKPLAAGARLLQGDWVNDDALALQAAATAPLTLAQVNPCLFAEPIAPHLAAQQAGCEITLEQLLEQAQPALQAPVDYLVIEGAGGWLVPLNQHQSLADFAAALPADIVLVVGLRLGCINHALLSVAAIESSGLRLAGWVANCVDPAMREVDANIDALRERIKAPLLGVIPHLQTVDSSRCAAAIDPSPLLTY